jgi:Family of unknown function (DUF6519)
MKGDFSRITFDAAHHFSRVLMQQGRVTVDADANEQAAILLHYVRTLARDLIGPCGGPVDALGFQLSVDPSVKPAAVRIGAGRYYVDGILCENDADRVYADQPDYTPLPDDLLLAELASTKPAKSFWLYLDVWERHITFVEDDRIREVALGGPDTATRTKVVWQVKALALPPPDNLGTPAVLGAACTGPLATFTAIPAGRMAAELDPGQQIKDPCVIAPDARYRGVENQLYRVEIHRGGTVVKPGDAAGDKDSGVTFKWSRDNGSVASAWLGTEGNDLVVASARGFSAGAWVELSDDARELRGEPGVLVKLSSVDGDRLTIDPASVPASASTAWSTGLSRPKVRRWDQTENDDITLHDGAIPIPTGSHWIDLEDGVRVQFEAGSSGDVQYRSGDYWLIPARVATGDIEWPRTGTATGGSTADFLPPQGIEHHYAPLGWLTVGANGGWTVTPCLCTLNPLSPCERPKPAAVTPVPPSPDNRPSPAPSPAPQPTPAPGRPRPGGPSNPGRTPR